MHGNVSEWCQDYQQVELLTVRRSGHVLRGVCVLVTFHFVIFGFVLVNQPTLSHALAVYRSVFHG